uniref:Uncharacterized protein n=1 Tax=Arundo donax TaxID=35708 RepID=A0A0A9CEB2_ARUDO
MYRSSPNLGVTSPQLRICALHC